MLIIICFKIKFITFSTFHVFSSLTYASLGTTIHDTLIYEVNSSEGNCISFSAKDNSRDSERRVSSGFPLTSKENGSVCSPHQGVISHEPCTDEGFSRCIQVKICPKRLPYEYLHSYPGPNEAPKNHLVPNNSDKIAAGFLYHRGI